MAGDNFHIDVKSDDLRDRLLREVMWRYHVRFIGDLAEDDPFFAFKLGVCSGSSGGDSRSSGFAPLTREYNDFVRGFNWGYLWVDQ